MQVGPHWLGVWRERRLRTVRKELLSPREGVPKGRVSTLLLVLQRQSRTHLVIKRVLQNLNPFSLLW